MPEGQSTQAVPDHRFPAPQEMHALTFILPGGDVVPAVHAVHAATSPVEKLPSAHVEQDEEPAGANLPAPQDVHDAVLPAADFEVPTGQRVQATANVLAVAPVLAK